MSTGSKRHYEIVVRKYNIYREEYQKKLQAKNFFDKLYRKSLQDNLKDGNKYESLCNVYTKYLDETQIDFFYKKVHIKVNFFCET